MAILKRSSWLSGLFFLVSIWGVTASPLTELTISQSYYAPASSTPVTTSFTLPYVNPSRFATTWFPDGSFVGVSVSAPIGVVNLDFQSCTVGVPLHVGTFTGPDLGCGPGTGIIGMGFAPMGPYIDGTANNFVTSGSVTISQVSFDSSGTLLSFAASYIIDSLSTNSAYPGSATYSGAVYLNADPEASIPEPAATALMAGGLVAIGFLLCGVKNRFQNS